MAQRIQKILSAHGVASRRESEKLILEGRVTVNGITATQGMSAEEGADVIAVDGVPISQKAEAVYIMLNKPRGYVTTMRDECGRKTVAELVSSVGVRVYPVGRLDMDSEGLLIMTNDGEMANRLMHPSFNKTKTYEVCVRGDVSGALAALRRPMMIDSREIRAVNAEQTALNKSGGMLTITIREGRNRQIRKMCAGCGLQVISLRRVSVGKLMLGGLKPGQWRHLTEDEIKLLR